MHTLKYSRTLQREDLAQQIAHSLVLTQGRGARWSGRTAGTLGQAICPSVCSHHAVPAAPALLLAHRLPTTASLETLPAKSPSGVLYQNSSLLSAFLASRCLHGGERLLCLLGRCDFVLQGTKSINYSSLYVMYIERYLVVLIYCGMGSVLACKGTGFVLGQGMQSQEVRMEHCPFAKTSPSAQSLLDKEEGSAVGGRHHLQGILHLML